MWRRIEKLILKCEWLVLVLVGVVILRVPTLYEPYWYGDESLYLTVGQALRKGAALYRDIYDHKPPLLYLVAAVANGNQFWFRLIAAAWNIVTVVVFGLLAKKWFKENRTVTCIVVWIFALLVNIPLFEGNIANAELFFLLPTLAAMSVLFGRQPTAKRAFLAGVFIGLGGLFKAPAVLEAVVWPFVWWAFEEKNWKRCSLVMWVGVAMVLGASVLCFASQGLLGHYIAAVGTNNVKYLRLWTTGDGGGVFALRGRVVLAAVAMAFLWGWAKIIGKTGTVVGAWGVVTLFAVLLSGRPYPHYFIQMAGVLAVSLGVVLAGKKIEKFVAAFLIGLTIVSFKLFSFYVYPIAGYYLNFGKWALGFQSQQSYYDWFSPSVNEDYEVARSVARGSLSSEKIFVWGDRPMIYALSKRLPVGKFTVKYHVEWFAAETETINRVVQELPKYIISYGGEEKLPGLKELLEWRYHPEKKIGGAVVYGLSNLSWWRY